jgi:hypothetical protein
MTFPDDYHEEEISHLCASAASFDRASEVKSPAPKGQICERFQADLACPALRRKIFLFTETRNRDLTAPSRASRRAYRDRHETWCGMRWTRGRARTTRSSADSEVVWSWPPDAGVKLAGDPRATVANKPGTPGRSRISCNTIAQGMPVSFGVPSVTTLVCFFVFAREAAGVQNARHSLCPLPFEGDDQAKLGQIMSRECAGASASSRGAKRSRLRTRWPQ